MSKKFTEPGKLNFPRFLFYGAFSDSTALKKHWTDIESKLDLKNWELHKFDNPYGLLTRISYELHRKEEYQAGSLWYKIGVFRDGFHITVRPDPIFGKIRNDKWLDMCKSVFGNANWHTGWTQEIEKVAPLTNKITKAVEEFFDETV